MLGYAGRKVELRSLKYTHNDILPAEQHKVSLYPQFEEALETLYSAMECLIQRIVHRDQMGPRHYLHQKAMSRKTKEMSSSAMTES